MCARLQQYCALFKADLVCTLNAFAIIKYCCFMYPRIAGSKYVLIGIDLIKTCAIICGCVCVFMRISIRQLHFACTPLFWENYSLTRMCIWPRMR